MSLGLQGKRILVTGASGFIGGRVTECLTRAYGAQVRALVHRLGTAGAARVARLAGVRLCYGDIRDGAAVDAAAQGCTMIVHCATGTLGGEREQSDATIGGTRHVLDAARQLGCERVVYFSSASVHGPARTGAIGEEDPLRAEFPYARMKIAAEVVVLQAHQRDHVPAVILRPTCVWGPWSPNWTVGAVELIRQGIPFLPKEGRGAANAVYVDHVVDAVVLALTHPKAAGEAFLVNDDAPSTWGELYGGYATYLGTSLRFADDDAGFGRLLGVSLHNAGVVAKRAVTRATPLGVRTLREAYANIPVIQAAAFQLPGWAKQRLKRYAAERELVLEGAGRVSRPPASGEFASCTIIPRPTRELYGSAGRYCNEKLKQRLGWRPRLAFSEAMARTCEWLTYAGYAR